MIGTLIVIGVLVVVVAVGGILVYKNNTAKVDTVLTKAQIDAAKVVADAKKL